VTVQNDVNVTGHVEAIDNIYGKNFRRGTTLPGTGNPGDLFVNHTTGQIYIWRMAGTTAQWIELVAAMPSDDTASSAIPTGTVITSLEAPSKMLLLGWVPLDGSTSITETQYPNLFKIVALAPYMSGTAPTRTMVMPNLKQRVLLVDFSNAGKRLGSWVANNVTLNLDNMPEHDHDIGVQSGSNRLTGSVANHDHSVSITPNTGAHGHTIGGGYHDHDINDPAHWHMGAEWDNVARPFIAVNAAAANKVDALFNDRSHTFSVDAYWYTRKATTGITVKPSSTHNHSVTGGAHDHGVDLTAAGGHAHNIHFVKQGKSKSFSITPEHFVVYAYVRS
jgi:hypothetical protein